MYPRRAGREYFFKGDNKVLLLRIIYLQFICNQLFKSEFLVWYFLVLNGHCLANIQACGHILNINLSFKISPN